MKPHIYIKFYEGKYRDWEDRETGKDHNHPPLWKEIVFGFYGEINTHILRGPVSYVFCTQWSEYKLSTDEVFSKRNKNESSNSHKQIWGTNGLRMGAWLGVINIHRVSTNLEDPVDVRNEPQQGANPQAFSSSNSFVWIWALIFVLFWENLTCTSDILRERN